MTPRSRSRRCCLGIPEPAWDVLVIAFRLPRWPRCSAWRPGHCSFRRENRSPRSQTTAFRSCGESPPTSRAAVQLDVAAFSALDERRKAAQLESDRRARRAQCERQGRRHGEGQRRGCGALLERAEALTGQLAASERRSPACRPSSKPAARSAEPAVRVGAGGRDEIGQRGTAPLGRAAEIRLHAARTTWRSAEAGRAGLRSRREDHRRPLLVMKRRRRAAASRAGAVHARSAHARARLHRSRTCLTSCRGPLCRAPASCRSSSRTCSACRRAGLLPDSDRRSAGHEPRARQIVEASGLPLKLVAHTPCFRSEAGAAGKDTRGLIRQHQFEKVELVQIVKPEDSTRRSKNSRHAEKMLAEARAALSRGGAVRRRHRFLQRKNLRPRSVAAGQNTYREISSCSNFEAFQARRMQARWRNRRPASPSRAHAQRLRASRSAARWWRCWRTTRTPTARSPCPRRCADIVAPDGRFLANRTALSWRLSPQSDTPIDGMLELASEVPYIVRGVPPAV